MRVARLAFAYRARFQRDVVIDMVCYRRHGHNEADEPAYTQPKMYALIEARRSIRKLYTESLINRGDITVEEAEAALADFQHRLEGAFAETHTSEPPASEPLPPPAVDDWARHGRPTVDTTAPNVAWLATPDELTNNTTASFAFAASEPSRYECAADGNPFARCTSPLTLPGRCTPPSRRSSGGSGRSSPSNIRRPDTGRTGGSKSGCAACPIWAEGRP